MQTHQQLVKIHLLMQALIISIDDLEADAPMVWRHETKRVMKAARAFMLRYHGSTMTRIFNVQDGHPYTDLLRVIDETATHLATHPLHVWQSLIQVCTQIQSGQITLVEDTTPTDHLKIKETA